MVGVVMSDEDVADVPQRDAREHELPRDAISAIDDVRVVVHDDDLC
jgi:hypothetical protein